MKYQFKCKSCEHDQTINMPMSEVNNDGHVCEKCGCELSRVYEVPGVSYVGNGWADK